MISVPNHRQPLSGNNSRKLLLLAVIFVAACSPKIKQAATARPQPAPPAKQVEKPVEKPQAKIPPPELKLSTISMLLPFNLDNINSGKGYSRADQKKANMALDYYQGFKLALDSLTALGYNYRVQLFDSKDQPAEARNLALNPRIHSSDLVVGPIFPDGLKSFSAAIGTNKKITVSPLSPASPASFHNNLLVTVVPPLSYHARRSAQYINDRLKPKKVFILKSGFSEENNYILPFTRSLDTISRQKIKAIPYSVVRGDLSALLPQLSKTEQNVFVVPATNQAFLQVTLRSLDTLAKHYPVTVIGHPNWARMTFLSAGMLQRLKTAITSTDHVNYKATNTINFVKSYRKAFHGEPSEYAIMGFDEGMYFGKLLGVSNTGSLQLVQNNFEGIHNNFHFVQKPGQGWINTNVNILKYVNFELKAVE